MASNHSSPYRRVVAEAPRLTRLTRLSRGRRIGLRAVGGGHDSFDFTAYAAAVERKDVPAWSSFFAEDAE